MQSDTVVALAGMKCGRYCFNPYEFNGKVYLCGAGSTTIEAFDPISHTFLTLSTPLAENSACIVFSVHNQLLILSQNHVTRWGQGQDQELVKISQEKHGQLDLVNCNMAPVVQWGRVYVTAGGKCYGIEMERWEKTEVAK